MATVNGSTLKQHTTQFRRKATTLGHDMEGLGAITKELASDAVDLLRENAADYCEMGMKKAGKLGKGVGKKIRSNPLKSLLIVAGLGLVAGAIWGRRE